MTTASGPCPGISEIERLAGGDAISADVAAHVESCDACRSRIDAARDEAKFVARVRSLAGPALGPEGAPRIPGYRTLDVVNAGAQGIVYRAVQETTSRTVAIKTLAGGPSASPRQRVRAEREAEIAARLRHPNIVTVFESRTLADGRIAVVMEYVDGVSLDTWKPPGDSSAARQRSLLTVFAGVCSAIHHAHLNGVIHRDLKPDNVLVTAEGRPVVLDFGIAKAGGVHTTLTGEFAGTPAYASPEQVSGKPDDVDALTDIYSLGVILYRLLCSVLPYSVEGSIFDIARTISQTDPIPPRRRDPTISPDLEAIVLRAMRKEKDLRYQSAADLGRDIERYLAGEPVDARSGSGWYLLRKAVVVNRRRLAWAGVALVVLIGAGVAVALSLASAAESARRAAQQREQARAENVRFRAVTELLREALPGADPEHPELDAIVGAGLGRLYFRLETGAFADDPEVDQALRRLWAGVYTELGSGKAAGLVEYAEVSLRNGLVRMRQEHGQDHPEIAAALHDLAGVVLVRRRAPEAEQLCRAALAMREKLLGPAGIDAGESRALLARILLALGRGEEAAREADAAISVFRSVPGRESDLRTASMIALKARVLMNAGDFARAEPLARDALTRKARRLAPEDPEFIASLADAAEVAVRCDGLRQELAAAWGCPPDEAAAAVRRDLPVLASPDRGIANEATRTGRTEALGRVFRLEEKLLGPYDPALVCVLLAQMRSSSAEGLTGERVNAALRAAEILSRRSGPDDPSVLVCIDEAALVLAIDGRPEQAVELARRSCRIRDAVPAGLRDPLVCASAQRDLGWYLSLAGRAEEGVAVLQSALVGVVDSVGPDHHLVALCKANLAYCLAKAGDLTQADSLSSVAAELADRLPGTHVDQFAHIRFVRGRVLLALGRAEDARRMLEQAWEPIYKSWPTNFLWRRETITGLADASAALGDPSGAASWRAIIDGDRVAAPTPAP